jgi:hypothetical protein
MKVFISYSSRDKALARRVAEVLEAAGLSVWADWREILPGDNWAEKIGQGLRESDAMVVLLTPDALESDSVQRDISYALGERRYSHRLIPVFVGGPEEFTAESVPWILKQLKVVNLPERGKREEDLKQIAQVLKEVA